MTGPSPQALFSFSIFRNSSFLFFLDLVSLIFSLLSISSLIFSTSDFHQ